MALSPWPAGFLRILIVDDNEDSANSLAHLLRMHRYEVHVAFGGAEALSLAREKPPDVVLIDLAMPLMSGYQTACELCEALSPARPLFAALTGFGDQEHRKRWQACGFEHYLLKPTDFNTILELLRSAKPASTSAQLANAS